MRVVRREPERENADGCLLNFERVGQRAQSVGEFGQKSEIRFAAFALGDVARRTGDEFDCAVGGFDRIENVFVKTVNARRRNERRFGFDRFVGFENVPDSRSWRAANSSG